MKKLLSNAFVAFMVAVIVPMFIFSIAEKTYRIKETNGSIAVSATDVKNDNFTFQLPVLTKEETEIMMNIEDYLVGVILAEMPTEFEIEALKSQAVVARTYALKRNTSGQKHVNGAVCMDSACCQAFCSRETFIEKGGTKEQIDKVILSVSETLGKVLCYDGALIEATYFSCSGGKTEDAQAVWGSYVPYLQSQDSPGEEKATHFADSVYFTKDEFAKLLDLNVDTLNENAIGTITYTAGGGIDSIEIGSKFFTGITLRKILNLNSTAFVMNIVGENICITTRGFGHRVGMSQYGAEAMAIDGKSYEEILAYYYPGTTLSTYSTN